MFHIFHARSIHQPIKNIEKHRKPGFHLRFSCHKKKEIPSLDIDSDGAEVRSWEYED